MKAGQAGEMKAGWARWLDSSAIGLSGLCLVHCLGLPILAAMLPTLGPWARAEWVHVAFVLLAAPLSALALLKPIHGRKAPPALAGIGVLGVSLLAFGAFGPEFAHAWVTIAGSTCLVGAHLWNWRRHGRAHAASA